MTLTAGDSGYVISTEESESYFEDDGWPTEFLRLQDSEKNMYENFSGFPHTHIVRLSDMKMVAAGDAMVLGNADAIISLLQALN